MKPIEKYLETITNENTKRATNSLIKSMGKFYNETEQEGIVAKIKEDTKEEVEMFIVKTLKGKSDTTISNTLSRMKKIYKYFGNEEAIKDINLMSIKQIDEFTNKNTTYYTPNDILNKMDELINYQDKALVMLIYLGLYDNDFKTIANLKREDFNNETKELKYNQDGNEKILKLTDFASKIIKGACEEMEMNKYIKQDGRKSKPYALQDNEYIFRSKDREGACKIVSTASFKKRIKTLKEYLEDDNFTAVSIKNSKNVYDLVRYEYDNNFGMDINQLELKEFLKNKEQAGTVELLNMSKKEMKKRIILDIKAEIDKKLFIINNQ